MQRVEPPIQADSQHVVTRRAFAVGAQGAIQRGPVVVIREQGAAITVGAERFTGKEAGRGGLRLGAELMAAEAGAEALRQVVEREQLLLRGDRIQRRPVRPRARRADSSMSRSFRPHNAAPR